MNFNHKLPYLV